jgi:hypothetical protein
LIPALLAVGVALAVINTRAVLEALLGIRSGFVRTAKYALGREKVRLGDVRYHRRSGWLPFLEIAIGSYFLYMMAFAIDTYNFFALPFLALFVAGYYWAGFATLWAEHQGRLRLQRERRLELEAAR